MKGDENLGDLLIKVSIYVNDKNRVSERRNVLPRIWGIEQGFIPGAWHLVNMAILNHHPVGPPVMYLDGSDGLRLDCS